VSLAWRCESALRSTGSCLWAFNLRNPFEASCIAAAVQRIAIQAERHRFTFRQTRRTVPMRFSTILVQASERRSSFGNPSRVTVRISSMPSRSEPATPDQSRSRRRARLRISFSAWSASFNSHACRNARRTEACSDLGNRSIMLRALWTLCRRRHKVHYAELRIMPTSAAKPAWEGVIAVKDAA
jgi:hypothetical protein